MEEELRSASVQTIESEEEKPKISKEKKNLGEGKAYWWIWRIGGSKLAEIASIERRPIAKCRPHGRLLDSESIKVAVL